MKVGKLEYILGLYDGKFDVQNSYKELGSCVRATIFVTIH